MKSNKIEKEIIVKNCNDCPFLKERPMFEGYYCGYPDSFIPIEKICIGLEHIHYDIIPNLCPLRVAKIEETRIVRLADEIS